MANLANADITFVPVVGRTRIIGRVRYVPGRMTIGNGILKYPSGGITPLPSKFGMYRHIDSIAVQGPAPGGLLWTYDRTNDKLKAYNLTKDTPFLVVEEAQSHTATGVVDVLSYIPAYIIAIHSGAGELYDVIPSGKTPLANEAAVNFATGVITLGSITAVGTVKVTYIPADDNGLWDLGNQVIDESLTAASSKVILNNKACAIQNVYNSTDGVIRTPVGDDQAVGTSSWKVVDSAQGITEIALNGGDNGDTILVTYIKMSGLDMTEFPYVPSAAITLSSQVINFLATTGYKGIAIPGLGTRVVGLDGVSGIHSIKLGGPSLTAANAKTRWDPHLNKITAAETTAVTTLRIPLILQDPDLRTLASSREVRVTEAPPLAVLDVVVTGW